MGPLEIDLDILEATCIKYLGLTIDRNVIRDQQMPYITRKICVLLSRFKLMKEYLDIPYLKTLYYRLILSRLSYAILECDGVKDANIMS